MLTLSVNYFLNTRSGSLNIVFESSALEKQCNNHKLLVKKQGSIRAKKIQQRLDDLRAAGSLQDMRMLPGRCHELKGNMTGLLTLDLDHPYRLIFEPANDPIPQKDDGGIYWNDVNAVRIIGIEDTHG